MRSLFVSSLSLIGACASEPAQLIVDGEAPPPAAPTLSLSGELVPCEPTTVRVFGARSDQRVIFAAGERAVPGASCPRPGICLGITNAEEIGRVNADPSGRAELTFVVPEGTPLGATFAFGAVAGSRPTNTIERAAQDHIGLFGVWDHAGAILELDDQRLSSDTAEGAVERFDNARQLALIRFQLGATYFGLEHWLVDNGQTWVCGAALETSRAAALASARPDRSDLGAGCFGQPWTALTPMALSLSGTWMDEWGTQHIIDDATWDQGWGLWHISRWSELDQTVIAQNDAAAAFFPGLWSRFDWVPSGPGAFYCQTAYDAPTELAARSIPSADRSDLAVGCSGFAWTYMEP